jgi:drug/metabolite transporter (DMT)-like permease
MISHTLQRLAGGIQAIRSNPRLPIIVAFAAVYLFWGSTYLAMRFAIETLPPFLMAAIRFVSAGSILYAWARWRGAPLPTLTHWRTAFIIGGLLLLGGNGGVVWAEQFVPSSLAALLVATVPMWVVVITSATSRRWPALPVASGVGLGLVGVVILVGPENIIGGARFSPVATAVVILAAFAFALGTHYSRHAPQPASPFMSTALSLLAGGLLLAVFGGLTGEPARLNLPAVSLKSWLAMAYLVIFGSLVGFSAYLWLAKVTTPAQASSNFYVNPLVAIILGWALAGETPTPRTILATLIIVGAVALIVLEQGRHAARQHAFTKSSTAVRRTTVAKRAAEQA